MALLFVFWGKPYDPYPSVIPNSSGEELYVKFRIGSQYRQIKLWRENTPEDGELSEHNFGRGYVFLPAGAALDEISFVFNSSQAELTLDHKQLKSGEHLQNLEIDREYVFSRKMANGSAEEFPIVFMKSQYLPSLYIETQSGSLTGLRADKNAVETGTIFLITDDGKIEYSGNLEEFSGRGNQSWQLNKRAWGFKLAAERALLGMNPAKKWVLLANAYDDSNGLRNKIIYSMALECGEEYARDLTFVDLYLNGIYAGTYQLTEKIEQGEHALNIGDLDARNFNSNPFTYENAPLERNIEYDKEDRVSRIWSDLNTPQDYSGGYILERNYGGKLEEKPYMLSTSRYEDYVIRSPYAVSKTEADYITSVVQHVENALFEDNSIDPVTGKYYTELLDLDSWVKKYLCDEISKNEGAGVTSSYFYKKQKDEKLYAGPAWDYDKSLGRYDCWVNPQGIANATLYNYNVTHTLYWYKFYNKPEAYSEITRQYETVFQPWLKEMLTSKLPIWKEEIAASFAMNYIRWKNDIESYDYPAQMINGLGDIDRSVQYISDWIASRMEFLDSIWSNGEEWHYIRDDTYVLKSTPYRYMYTKHGEPAGDQIEEASKEYEKQTGQKVLYWIDIDEPEHVIESGTVIDHDIAIEPVCE